MRTPVRATLATLFLSSVVYSLAALAVPLYPVSGPEELAASEADSRADEGVSPDRPDSLVYFIRKRPHAPTLLEPLNCIEDISGDVEELGQFRGATAADIVRLCASYGKRLRLDAEFDRPMEPLIGQPLGNFAIFRIEGSSGSPISISVALGGNKLGQSRLDLGATVDPAPSSSCNSAVFWDESRLKVEIDSTCVPKLPFRLFFDSHILTSGGNNGRDTAGGLQVS